MAVGEQRVDDSTLLESFSIFSRSGGFAEGVFLGGCARFLRMVDVTGLIVLARGEPRPLVKRRGARGRARVGLVAEEERGMVKVGYSSVESVLGEQVGHNFAYW